MKKLILILLSVFAVNAFAADVTEFNQEYKTVTVKATQVDGVKLYLTKEFVRTDCNQISIDAKDTFTDGNMDGDTPINWHSKYIITASSFRTEMYCPVDTAVTETIQSNEMDFKSYTNPNIDREVLIDVIIPVQYDLVVEEY